MRSRRFAPDVSSPVADSDWMHQPVRRTARRSAAWRRGIPALLWIAAALGAGSSSAAPPPARPASPPPLRVPGLDSLAVATLDRALGYLNLRPEELGFDKLYVDDDTFRLGVVEEILNDPLKMPGWQQEAIARIRDAHTSPPELARLLGELMEAPAGATAGGSAGATSSATGGALLPAPDVEAAIARFLDGCRAADAKLTRAFAGMTDEERDRVTMLAPAFWGDAESPLDKLRKGALHRETGAAVDTTLKWTEDPVLDAAVRLDRGALTEATVLYLGALERLEADLEPLLPSPGSDPTAAEEVTSLPGVTGPIRYATVTPWGLFVIGGSANNEYSAEACARIAFLVDPAGDDVYRGRVASAIGGITRTLSAAIDLGGNDLYEAGVADDGMPRTFTVGGALFGLAALLDRAGDDVYRADDGSLGASFFGGGFLFDGGGRDLFDGRNLCEGSGAFGIGALVTAAPHEAPPGPELEVDRGFELGLVKVAGTGARPIRFDDNDTYLCARQSQGFASTLGIGLLYDRVGNDVYRSGGTTLHRPLLPNDFQSLSQGYSIGFRPRAAGGIGLLLDEEGNDFYDAEVYAQGVSYWYSIGLLADLGGNDRYLATQYAQGAGVHLSVGSLYDRGGDDHYVCKLGVTQGTAHDLSVGWQIDDSGNDFYIVSDGQGISITNSVAIFIDGQGDDVYATPGAGQGWLSWARGFCGPGIFLDLEGRDVYPAQSGRTEGYGRDGAVWSPDVYSIGIDLARDVTLPSEVVLEPVLTAADSAMTLEQLYELSNIWEVGSAREKVRRARKALIERGLPAVHYCLEHGLDSQDGLVYRNLVEIGKVYPDSFAALLLPRLRDPDVWVQRNTISLLGELKRTEARPRFEAMLREPAQEKHHNRLIQALGNLGDRAALPAVRPFLNDPTERRRIATVVALSALKDTASVGPLVRLLGDSELTVRSAASSALLGFPGAAIPALIAAGRGGDAGTGATGGLARGVAVDEPLRVRTLGKLAVALRDSTGAASVEARYAARRELFRVLEEGSIAPASGVGPDPAPAAAVVAAADAAAVRAATRAAAVDALLTLGDEESRERVRLRMRDEADPLVTRTFERRLEELGPDD